MRALALVSLLAAPLAAQESARLLDLGGAEAAFARRFNEGAGRVRFVAVLSPG